MSMFAPARRERRKAKIGVLGPAGSGKTMTSLRIMRGLVGDQGRIALIDTEHGSASLYADATPFEVVELTNFSPDDYIAAINAAVAEGFDGLVIDSLSHAWAGKGGLLEFVDQAAKRSTSGSSFNAWRDATPQHHRLVEAMVSAPIHLIVTMRTKMEHVQEKDERTGKTVIRKVGMAPVQRDGLEYEFDLVADMDLDHFWKVSKTRYAKFADAVEQKPGEEVGAAIVAFLDSGDEPLVDAVKRQLGAMGEDEKERLRVACARVGGTASVKSLVMLGEPARDLAAWAAQSVGSSATPKPTGDEAGEFSSSAPSSTTDAEHTIVEAEVVDEGTTQEVRDRLAAELPPPAPQGEADEFGEYIEANATPKPEVDDDPLITRKDQTALFAAKTSAKMMDDELRRIVFDVTGSRSTSEIRKSQLPEIRRRVKAGEVVDA